MLLEAAADPYGGAVYGHVVDMTALPWRILTRRLVRHIARQIASGAPPGLVARRFHSSMAWIMRQVCRLIRDRNGVNRVCLSGGTFQNLTLLKASTAGLRRDGFEVYTHAQVPPNDGGISLGQALVAATRLEKGQAGSLD
jgi:hydrogenase maturation protein HypF